MRSKKVKVIMLPTTDNVSKGIILLRHLWKDDPKLECRSIWQYKETVVIENVKQYTVLNSSFRDEYKSFVPQHLYFVTDDEIKEGDWILSDTSIGAILIDGKTLTVEMLAEGQWKKIIATTNKLIVKDNGGPADKDDYLPQLPQSFIEGYCLLDGIDEVMVEYFDDKITYAMYSTPNWKLKTDSHNILIIKSVKDSWSWHEVMTILHDYRKFAWVNGSTKKDLQKWIKNNL